MSGKPQLTAVFRNFDRNWKLDPDTGCHVWQRALDTRGYGKLYVGSAEKSWVSAHRFSFERLHGKLPSTIHICHKCDNPTCVNPDHLFAGSNTDNRHDSVKKRRHAHHERHGRRKLNSTDAERIRDIWRVGGPSQKEIADYFGISQTQVSRIVNKRHWS